MSSILIGGHWMRLYFRVKKLNLSDFGHYYRPDSYFANGELELSQFGLDMYNLGGQISSNLALCVR